MTERLRQSWRITQLAAHIAIGLGLSGLVFPFIGARGRRWCFRWWSRRMLRIVRLTVRVHGAPHALPPRAPHMLLANHVSWLDVFVLRAHVECRFVAKSEIRRWPLVGWMVSRQGTVFVQRARKRDTARVNESVEAALASGEAVVVFPEGTTTDGTEVKPFHASLLQPLVHAHGWAVPVGLRYVCEDGSRDPAPAYVAERSLWDTTLLITARPALEAELFFGEPVHAVGRHRRDLAEVTAASVASCLGLPSPARRQPS